MEIDMDMEMETEMEMEMKKKMALLTARAPGCLCARRFPGQGRRFLVNVRVWRPRPLWSPRHQHHVIFFPHG